MNRLTLMTDAELRRYAQWCQQFARQCGRRDVAEHLRCAADAALMQQGYMP